MADAVAPSPLENEPGISRHRFRGIDYVLHEVTIGKFDDIQKAATTTIKDRDDNEIAERLDQALQMRLLLLASVIEPRNFTVEGKPAPVIFALNTAVNKLHDPAEDELAVPKKAAADEDKEPAKKA